MCAAVCSRNVINIKLNEEGFYRPYVDKDKCTDCGLCTKVCYKYDDEVKVTSLAETREIDKVMFALVLFTTRTIIEQNIVLQQLQKKLMRSEARSTFSRIVLMLSENW